MSLQVNLSRAAQALTYVQSKMTIGASNKFRDLARSLGGSALCVVASRSVDIGAPRGPVPSWLRGMAAKAKATGCGNCGEQAAVAFVYLYEQIHAKPLDYMARTNADHAFVVIGRMRQSRIDDYTTWGNDAVVCDAWDDQVYPAREIPTKMYGGGVFKPEGYYRLD